MVHIINSLRKSAFSEVVTIPAFRKLWFSQILSQVAINTLIFILALHLYTITRSNMVVSGLFLVYGAPALIFGIVAGSIVDKIENRYVLLLCDLSRAILVSLLFFNSDNIALIYAITLANSIITQFYVPAEAPTIPFIVPQKYIMSANSMFSFTYFSSLAVGSIISGIVLKTLGPGGSFMTISILFLLAAANVYGLPLVIAGKTRIKTIIQKDLAYLISRVFQNVIAGLSYLKTSRRLGDALFLLVTTQIVIAILGTLGPGFADRLLKIDIRDSSILIMGPVVLGLVTGAVWVGNAAYRTKPGRLMNTGLFFSSLILVTIALISRWNPGQELPQFLTNIRFSVIIILFFILGFANSLLDIPANSILQEEAQGDMRGKVYGVLATFVGGVGILPVVMGGFLADTVGVGTVILILGLVLSAFSIWRLKLSQNKL